MALKEVEIFRVSLQLKLILYIEIPLIMLLRKFLSTCLVFGHTIASVLHARGIDQPTYRRNINPACVNSPSSRQYWSDGFSIETDSETKWPVTRKIVSV